MTEPFFYFINNSIFWIRVILFNLESSNGPVLRDLHCHRFFGYFFPSWYKFFFCCFLDYPAIRKLPVLTGFVASFKHRLNSANTIFPQRCGKSFQPNHFFFFFSKPHHRASHHEISTLFKCKSHVTLNQNCSKFWQVPTAHFRRDPALSTEINLYMKPENPSTSLDDPFRFLVAI